jgi:hypothetical protein
MPVPLTKFGNFSRLTPDRLQEWESGAVTLGRMTARAMMTTTMVVLTKKWLRGMGMAGVLTPLA